MLYILPQTKGSGLSWPAVRAAEIGMLDCVSATVATQHRQAQVNFET